MSWTVALFVCAIAGAAGLSPEVILPVIAVALTVASADRVLRVMTDHRPAQPVLICVIVAWQPRNCTAASSASLRRCRVEDPHPRRHLGLPGSPDERAI